MMRPSGLRAAMVSRALSTTFSNNDCRSRASDSMRRISDRSRTVQTVPTWPAVSTSGSAVTSSVRFRRSGVYSSVTARPSAATRSTTQPSPRPARRMSQQLRPISSRGAAASIAAPEPAVVREDEDAVRHRVERDLPRALGARDQLEQLGLRHPGGELRGDRLDERDLVALPAADAVGLVDDERAAEAPLHDERAEEHRARLDARGQLAHVLVHLGRRVVVVARVVDDERLELRLQELPDRARVRDGVRAEARGAGGAERLTQLVRRRVHHLGQVERGADGVAQAVDERLPRGGGLGALVEFGLPDGDAGLVGDGARERHVRVAPAAPFARDGDGEGGGYLRADADADVHDRARAELAEDVLVDAADGRVVRHVLEGEVAVRADAFDQIGDERDAVLASRGHLAGRDVLGEVARDAGLAVEHEEHAAVYAELLAQLGDRGAEDLVRVERAAHGARDAVDHLLALGLRGEPFGVAAARDELRDLAREGDRGQHARAVGRAARARVVERDEAEQLALVRADRREQLVALV